MPFILNYSDLNQNLSTDLVFDLDSIQQHIINILTTKKGTLLFRSDFGSNIEDYLFDLMSPETEAALLAELVQAIRLWEPRVEIDQSLTTVVSDSTNHIVWVMLYYTVKATGVYIHQEIGLKR